MVPGDDVVLGQAVEQLGDLGLALDSRGRGPGRLPRVARGHQASAETRFGHVRPPAGAVRTHP